MATRYKLFAALVLSVAVRAHGAPACQDSGVRETPSVYFANLQTKEQSALLPEDGIRSEWVELRLSGNQIVVSNQMGGLGLPLDIYNILIEVIDEAGRVRSEIDTQIPLFANCDMLTLFPGQIAKPLKLPFDRSTLPAHSRLRIRLLTNSL